MKNKNLQHGRSMIEMLGVLGIMAVITVLGILIYQLALKNSKMNKLKQDVANISQALDQSYSRQKFTDTGVVLGTDRTFENMFVDTNFFKSATTPFGGTYSLTGISQDLFELKVTGPDEKDCIYMVNDDSFLRRLEKATLACEDENGLIHYAANHPDKPGVSQEVLDLINNYTDSELISMCSSDENACIALANSENASAVDLYTGCRYSKTKEVCKAAASHANSNSTYINNACYWVPEACAEAVLEGTDEHPLTAAYACKYENSEAVCDIFASDETASAVDLYTGCRYSKTKEVCKVAGSHADADSTYVNNACYWVPEACAEAVLEGTDEHPLTAAYACKYENSEAVCDIFASDETASAVDLYVGCSYSRTKEVCKVAASHADADPIYVANACSWNPDVCAEAVLAGEGTVNTALYACKYEKSAEVCAASCAAGNTGDCP